MTKKKIRTTHTEEHTNYVFHFENGTELPVMDVRPEDEVDAKDMTFTIESDGNRWVIYTDKVTYMETETVEVEVPDDDGEGTE